MRHWLFKSEPDCYSFTDLENAPGQTTSWDGVRNYQARNFMRDDMKKGDLGFFYHSGKNPEIAGIVEIVREGHPDLTAQDPEAGHFDPKATPGDPRWYMVDVKLVRRFEPPVPRSLLRFVPELAEAAFPYSPWRPKPMPPSSGWRTSSPRTRRRGKR